MKKRLSVTFVTDSKNYENVELNTNSHFEDPEIKEIECILHRRHNLYSFQDTIGGRLYDFELDYQETNDTLYLDVALVLEK